ncbi:hypothetical protein ACQ4LE_001264 [Meloidogyne hapla]
MVCEKNKCFIGVDKNKMGIVQGCGKCSEKENINKCEECNNTLCNNENILLPPINCYYLTTNIQPYKIKNKTCHQVYDSCYIARDVFWRAEQNCGECPSKYKNCVSCKNKNLCNDESLLPLTTKKILKTTTTIISKNVKETTEISFRINNKTFKSSDNKIKIMTMIFMKIFNFILYLNCIS